MSEREATSREKVFREIHNGKTYARTRRKYGKSVANKQVVAIYFSKKRQARKRAQGKRY